MIRWPKYTHQLMSTKSVLNVDHCAIVWRMEGGSCIGFERERMHNSMNDVCHLILRWYNMIFCNIRNRNVNKHFKIVFAIFNSVKINFTV